MQPLPGERAPSPIRRSVGKRPPRRRARRGWGRPGDRAGGLRFPDRCAMASRTVGVFTPPAAHLRGARPGRQDAWKRLPMNLAPKRSGFGRWLWAVGAALAAGVLAAWYFLPIERWIGALVGFVESLGLWGVLAFALAYV